MWSFHFFSDTRQSVAMEIVPSPCKCSLPSRSMEQPRCLHGWELNLAKSCPPVLYRAYHSNPSFWAFWPHDQGFHYINKDYFFKKKKSSFFFVDKSISISHLLPAIKKIPGSSLISKNPAPTKGLTSLLLSLGDSVVGMIQSYLASKKTFSHLLKRCLQFKSGKTGRWVGWIGRLGLIPRHYWCTRAYWLGHVRLFESSWDCSLPGFSVHGIFSRQNTLWILCIK